MARLLNTAPLSKDWYGAKGLKKALLALFTLLAVTSCSLSGSAMTVPDFDRIQKGTPISEVIAEAGEPFNITSPQEGIQQYRYIERIETGPGRTSQNMYILTVVNGQVVDKQRTTDASPLNLQYR